MSDIRSNATVTLTVNGKQAQDMLDGLKKKSQDLEKAIDKAAQAGKKQDLKRLQKELKQTNRQISQIESAAMGVERTLKSLDKASPKDLQRTLSTLRKQLNGIERGTEEWNAQCAAIKRVKAEIDRVNDNLRTTEGRWSRFNRIVNDWQTTIMGAAAAVTGLVMAGRSAVKAYADMESEMANVRKFTGMTAEEVEELNEELKKIDTRTSREDLNKLAQEAGRLGKTSQEDVLGFVRAADKINVALDDLGDGATLTLSKLTSIFGDEERLGTERALLAVGSVINELSQNCTAAAPYLANFAQRMAGVGAQAKMTIPQIMGFAAVLDSQGQAVEMSATALSKLIMDMFKEQDKVIKATGLNAEKFKETLKRSTNEGLLMLLDRLHELGNIDVLAPVFKDMGENGARAAQVISALAGNLEMVKWEQGEAAKAFAEGTSVTKEFDVQNNTVQAGLDKAKKSVTELAVELGEQLMPVMRHVISSTTLILKVLSTVVGFLTRYKAEIITATAVTAAYAVAVNLASIRTKAAAAIHAVWNAVVKAGNVLLPIAQVLMNGMRLAWERLIWQTRGATAAQQAYNKSLVALRASAASAKLAWGIIAVAIAAAAIALARYIKSQNEEARIQRAMNDIRAEAAKKAVEQKIHIDNLVAAAKNERLSLVERQKAIKELNSIIPGYNAHLDATSGRYVANKQKLDEYIASLVRMYEVMGARESLVNLGKQKADLNLKLAEEEEKLKRERENRNKDYGIVPGASTYNAQGLAEINYTNGRINSIKKDLAVLEKTQQRITAKYGKDIEKAEVGAAPQVEPQADEIVPVVSPSGESKGTNNTNTEDKLKKEKQWKEREEAVNRIHYATGQKNYEAYTKRMIEIEIDYYRQVLEHADLSEQERLAAEASYQEARKKLQENELNVTAEKEKERYNEEVAIQKQKFIDGETDQETYNNTLELLELQHKKRMVSIYKEGTKEYLEANKAYQDKLVADQIKRQKETEQKEKEHQKKLDDIKSEYFGDNASERRAKYDDEIGALNEIYNSELQAAGNNAKEKLRIEEAYQKAKIAIKKKYNQEEEEENGNFLQDWAAGINEWMQSDLGKAVSGSLDVVMSGMSSIFSQMTSLIQAETEIQTAAIEKRYRAEISAAEGNNYMVKRIEKKKEDEVAKVKNEANRKMYTMQVIQAVAQTATSALNAYSSAAAIPVTGWLMAPIAAATAVAAGMLQVAAIKKQQKAAEAQGYYEGGYTDKGKSHDVVGVVHANEWVASERLVNSPVARPMIEALDYAQRTNSIGTLRNENVSRYIAPQSQTVVVQDTNNAAAAAGIIMQYAAVMERLKERLDEPFVTVNTVTGDKGIKQAQDEYNKLIRNKTPKSRRK